MASILVVDDDDIIAELVRIAVGNAGHTVEIAEDGETALSRVSTGRFDLVLLDAMMPGMSGFAVLEALRSNAATASLLVIMLTSRRSPEEIENALSAGADDYITKPFMPDELVARIALLLENGKTAESSTA